LIDWNLLGSAEPGGDARFEKAVLGDGAKTRSGKGGDIEESSSEY